ncbi:MAG: general secretion pathway protein GspK [Nitrospinaceae bacterium]|nr:general secretion pathway protein GspK [Nitrospinaceae bacterium]
MTMKKLNSNQSGIALMIVLWVLVLLMALATEFAFSMKMEVNTTRNYKEDTESYYLAKAGLNLALAELFKNASFHSIHDEYGWIAGNPAPTASTENPPEEGAQEFDIVNRTDIELENGTITYTIRDENGKISINSASKVILNQLLAYSGVKEKIDQDTISDSILDWIDTDKNHRLNGAEDDYYRTQRPPYYAKNGKFETLSELLKVRGVTEEILYGSQDEGGEYKGIAQFLTVYNFPLVNPNTASEEVLNIIYLPEQAVKILNNRSTKGYNSNNLSTFFRVTSTGKVQGSRTEHTLEAVLEKTGSGNSANMVIHYWNDNVLDL